VTIGNNVWRCGLKWLLEITCEGVD